MGIELKNEERKEYDYPDPNDRIGKIGYGGCLAAIILILSFIFLVPLTTWLYEWQIDGNQLKNIDPPFTQSHQKLRLSNGLSIEVFNGPVMVLKDKKRNIVWSLGPEQIQCSCKSIRLDSWIHIPFDSIRVKGRMAFDEGPEKDIMFLLHPDGKLKTIYGKS